MRALAEGSSLPPGVTEETVAFSTQDEPPLRIEGRYQPGLSSFFCNAIFCHPHPQFGGDLKNKVVEVATRTVASLGGTTLRFNFRGVGRSEGSYGGGEKEVNDLRAAITYLNERSPDRSLLLVGYSFGTSIISRYLCEGGQCEGVLLLAPPLEMYDLPPLPLPSPWGLFAVVGDRDFFCTTAQFLRYLEQCGPEAQGTILEGADHFFHGYMGNLSRLLLQFLQKEPRQ